MNRASCNLKPQNLRELNWMITAIEARETFIPVPEASKRTKRFTELQFRGSNREQKRGMERLWRQAVQTHKVSTHSLYQFIHLSHSPQATKRSEATTMTRCEEVFQCMPRNLNAPNYTNPSRLNYRKNTIDTKP